MLEDFSERLPKIANSSTFWRYSLSDTEISFWNRYDGVRFAIVVNKDDFLMGKWHKISREFSLSFARQNDKENFPIAALKDIIATFVNFFCQLERR